MVEACSGVPAAESGKNPARRRTRATAHATAHRVPRGREPGRVSDQREHPASRVRLGEPRDDLPAPVDPRRYAQDAKPLPARRKQQVILTLSGVHVIRRRVRRLACMLGGALSLTAPISILIFLATGARPQVALSVGGALAGMLSMYCFCVPFGIAADDRRARVLLVHQVAQSRFAGEHVQDGAGAPHVALRLAPVLHAFVVARGQLPAWFSLWASVCGVTCPVVSARMRAAIPRRIFAACGSSCSNPG
jgi:hypothetical protein